MRQSPVFPFFLSLIVSWCYYSFFFVSPFYSLSLPAHWTYDQPENGPTMWGLLDISYTSCAKGQQQSPIDFRVQGPSMLTGKVIEDPYLSPLIFHYQLSNTALIHHDNITHTDELINNGHTVQVNYESGSSIEINNKQYNLIQFHFHSPSEHTVNGRSFAMEMHLVHQNIDDKSLAVIGVLLQTPSGSGGIQPNNIEDRMNNDGENQFLDTLFWDDIPNRIGSFILPETRLNVFTALPFNLGYYHYYGSLTTPPCTENVNWYVLKQPVTISERQRSIFLQRFGKNARPTQPLYRRNITMSIDTILDDFSGPKHSGTVSLDAFIGVVGGCVVVSLLLLFAICFIANRSNHGAASAALLSTPSHSIPIVDQDHLYSNGAPKSRPLAVNFLNDIRYGNNNNNNENGPLLPKSYHSDQGEHSLESDSDADNRRDRFRADSDQLSSSTPINALSSIPPITLRDHQYGSL